MDYIFAQLLWIGCWNGCEIGLAVIWMWSIFICYGLYICSGYYGIIGCCHVCEIGLAVIWMWSIFICYGWYSCSVIMDWMLTWLSNRLSCHLGVKYFNFFYGWYICSVIIDWMLTWLWIGYVFFFVMDVMDVKLVHYYRLDADMAVR